MHVFHGVKRTLHIDTNIITTKMLMAYPPALGKPENIPKAQFHCSEGSGEFLTLECKIHCIP